MNKSRSSRFSLKFALLAAAASLVTADIAQAQYFNYQPTNSDLMLGFRKTGSFAENNEMVVDLGSVTNLLRLSVGTTVNISNYSNVQIRNMCPDNLANLQWSAFSAFPQAGLKPTNGWNTSFGTFAAGTCWYTLPRTDFNTQSTPLPRGSSSAQGSTKSKITAVGHGAAQISSALVSTNQFNNSVLVTEPTSFAADNTLSTVIGDPNDVTFGDFGGQGLFVALVDTVENTTPDPFDSPQRCDFYQSCPTATIDPLTGQTNGPAYYVGYFTLNTDGTMTFTRDVTSTVVNNPPPPPVLTIIGSLGQTNGNPGQITSMISFATTNGATYSLYYTNAAGLTSPVTNWTLATGNIIGDGSVHTFTNTATDPSRFYQVVTH